MNVVFPVEYWPTSNTVGRQQNSASSSGGLWRLWNKWVSSKGRRVLLYWYWSPSFTVLKSSFLEKLRVRLLREPPFLLNQIIIIMSSNYSLPVHLIHLCKTGLCFAGLDRDIVSQSVSAVSQLLCLLQCLLHQELSLSSSLMFRTLQQ